MIPGSSRPARKLKLNEAVLTADSFPGTGSDRHRVFFAPSHFRAAPGPAQVVSRNLVQTGNEMENKKSQMNLF